MIGRNVYDGKDYSDNELVIASIAIGDCYDVCDDCHDLGCALRNAELGSYSLPFSSGGTVRSNGSNVTGRSSEKGIQYN